MGMPSLPGGAKNPARVEGITPNADQLFDLLLSVTPQRVSLAQQKRGRREQLCLLGCATEALLSLAYSQRTRKVTSLSTFSSHLNGEPLVPVLVLLFALFFS